MCTPEKKIETLNCGKIMKLNNIYFHKKKRNNIILQLNKHFLAKKNGNNLGRGWKL